MTKRYKLNVYNNNIQVKLFYGDDKCQLVERFEKWFIKQPYERENISYHLDECQHARNV